MGSGAGQPLRGRGQSPLHPISSLCVTLPPPPALGLNARLFSGILPPVSTVCARYKPSSPEEQPETSRRRLPYGQAAPRPRRRSSPEYEEDELDEPQALHIGNNNSARAQEPPADAFGLLGSSLSSGASASDAEENPWQELRRPPRKGIGIWRALGILLFFPFRMIGFLTRRLPTLILWPLRIAISLSFVGLVLALVMAVIYGIKAERYDITQVMRMPERSIVLDRKGNEIGTLHGENRRSIAGLDEVPQYFIDALVLQEDRSFWTHGGIDPRGLLRAVSQVFKHHRTTQGASTLTMQLAKNTYDHRERNMDAKLTEMALARRMEATYDKKTILTCYINRVFWGHTFLGLKQAAYGYFSKQPRDLSIGEAAMLAGIVCSPNQFSPYRKLSAARVQRDKVLKLLYEHGKITRNQYEAACAEPITTRKPPRRGTDNYALDLIRSEVDHVLTMLESQDRRVKEEAVYSGGLTVRTTLDVDLQDDVIRELDAGLIAQLESVKGYPYETRAQFMARREAAPAEAREGMRPKYVQAACVIIDNNTGALIAVVGGRDSEESPLNRAVQSRRQVGSLFKPIVYATFFERGGSPNSMISDNRLQPGEIAGAKRWNPGNSDGRFTGMHPASWGLLKSRNTMSVRVGNRAGLANVAAAARMAGFPPMAKPPGPTIYLGTWEASPLEVAGAYTAFANGGVRPTPYIIQSITDASGRVLWSNQRMVRRVFSPRAANATSAILQQITKPGGTAGRMQQLGFTAPSGGKTGTTNGYKNAWFCGFTSELTAAVWVGFDRPRMIADKAYGGTLAMPLWVRAMKAAERRGYAMGKIRTSPASGQRAGIRLCRSTGAIAHSGCEYEGTAYIETMADVRQPRPLCTQHDQLAEDPASLADDDVAEDPDAPSGTLPDDDFAEDPNATPDIDDTAEEV